MTISVISFTGRGRQLSRIVSEQLKEERVLLYTGERAARTEEADPQGLNTVRMEKRPDPHGTNQSQLEAEIVRVADLAAWAGAQFAAHRALLFIGACGIAVRSIAPFVQNKLTDSPVLVMDEGGGYVIPILSGHAGGADRLARRIAECMGAVPVITAATDINGRFAVDVFAQRQGLSICDRSGIGKVSARILRGETVTVAAEGMTAGQCRDWFARKLGVCPPELVPTDELRADIWIGREPRSGAVLWLKPRLYILGMGCKKGKTYGELRIFVDEILEQAGIAREDVYALASIHKKREEAGLWDVADSFRAPFLTFSAEELRAVPGEFDGSFFVESQVGVDNVCERAALACCGAEGSLVLGKTSREGMTLAIARRDWTV